MKYIHTDALGSVVAVTDQNRNVLERREYEPYGQQLTPVLADGPGYTGHVQDAATGLTYMQQRYYDPVIGGFLSVDPVSVDTTTVRNFCRYCYASNNPYKFTDPDGRESAQIHLDRDVRDFGSGRISKQEYFDNIGARAAGAGIGAAVVGGTIVAAPFAADAGVAVLANPGAVATATEIAAGAAGVTGTAGAVAKTITLSARAQGQAAIHARDAIAAGKPSVLTIARDGAGANRAASIGGMAKVPGKHLDEYPPAMFREGGAGASVRAISPADNMSAGACIGNACRGLADGARVRIEVGD
ncbi:RHS repeat-associated core domain-containing protein [Luteimonas sp. RD2P54]|uniref:RHS repeat-associated core domain-containing protein n=1 Tax=Luteimonas endophytica TaxID=3042023 RepID=A0ABT6JBU8_9GAMM|nr:RHS repeat-associated core domain-containing protein [Luteimonas endophytica]MDH5824290.1 RHS repeat-associated core domain-containing protein [Luteimonas endophytica]